MKARISRSLLTGVMGVQSILSAGTYLAAKRGLSELSFVELGLLRFTLAASCYGAILASLRPRVTKRDLWGFLFLGFISVPVNQLFFLAGMAHTSPAHAALLYALSPMFVFLMARYRLGERTNAQKIAGITLAFVGVVVVLFSRTGPGQGLLHVDRSTVIGDLLVLVAVVSWALYTVVGKPYAERNGATVATAGALISGTLLYLPIGLVGAKYHHIRALSIGGWGAVGYLVIVTSVVAYVIFYWALARAEASQVAVFANLQPVVTAILSWAIYGETLTAPFIFGGAMVLLGVFLTERG